MKAKLVVVGAGGRMGRRIVALAVESERFDIVGSVDAADHPDQDKDVGVLAGVEAINVRLCPDFPEQADVVIDFSLPQATAKTIQFCRTRGVSLVLGTTGIDEPLMTELRGLAEAMRTLGVPKGLVLTYDQETEEEVEGTAIPVMPAWRWLIGR